MYLQPFRIPFAGPAYPLDGRMHRTAASQPGLPDAAPRFAAGRVGLIVLLAVLAGCAVRQPRTDDPWEPFNRRMYAFNERMDKAVIRPVAVGYRKLTTPNLRRALSNFFANIRMPITIGNDILQGDATLKGTGRFLINTTVGFLGFLDPASRMHLPARETDFGVTLARWGIGEGPYSSCRSSVRPARATSGACRSTAIST